MAVTRVAYEADGWGEGELWFDGPVLVWHELPRPPVHLHPGGASTHRPLGSTISGKGAPGRNETAPNARQLVHRVRAYFQGERVDFDDVSLDLDGYTPFQLDVVRTLRRIPYGEVLTYGELAQNAGYPNAQRAAGTFCANNRFPLVLPCHRIVAANGLGGYGSLGADYKRRLLELEGSLHVV